MATKRRAAFAPQTTGIFVLLVIVLAFAAGTLRGELALTLLGAVFLAVWLYCLAATLLAALIQSGRARNFSLRVTPREIAAGDSARVVFADSGKFFRLPGALVRCRLLLNTRDGRQIRRDFDPAPRGIAAGGGNAETFEAKERGAYFSAYDELAVFDALGFFRFAWRIPHGTDARLLVCPRPAADPPAPALYSGGTERPAELRQRRSDTLVDHRPYIPGDDPRRINWKLFGHGGELFVREGEPEPPPRSNILILIDTHYDTALYSAASARRGVDLLCEYALAAALDCAEAGMDMLIGFSGGEHFGVTRQGGEKNAPYLRGNNPAELTAVFALPAAIPRGGRKSGAGQPSAELPEAPPDGRGVLLFALPGINAESPELSRFLDNRSRNGENKINPVEVIFLYSDGGASLDEAAEICAVFYKGKPGVRARRIKVGE